MTTQSASIHGVLADSILSPSAGASLWLKRAALVAAGVAAVAIASKARIPLWPVPITLQTFAVLSIGAAYGPRLGLATIIAWLALGAAGLDVFAATEGGARGLSYMFGDSGGYLAGFALAAGALGFLAMRGWDRTPTKTAAMMAIGNAIIYAPGLAWLTIRHGVDAPILQWGLYPFLIGDIAKLALAMAVFPLAWRAVGRARG